jgi:hypothetical protein
MVDASFGIDDNTLTVSCGLTARYNFSGCSISLNPGLTNWLQITASEWYRVCVIFVG